ncbi:hypothetical protein [Puniceibacterium sp. IMCC21224]|uniref:hypothetical protein n=1 Tax=Puniceibacterium sp. IMCC21224 TaxID=1618204 RepID=UPI00065CCBB4|nr:hypothetical protein [Puniceibacterium sp. IMCC21224]KMK67748.1 hypothetical protein IMCC21224_112622 [Puniceibacterium sp. IMCC21224]
MLTFILIVIAGVLGGGAAPGEGARTAVVDPMPVAEPQTPTGRFTTATEVRPILMATSGSWVVVREYDGQDLLYVTHLFAWRCGLVGLRYGVNDGPMTDWPLPPCHEDSAAPNALLPEDGVTYLGFDLGSVARVRVEIVYDDLETQSQSYVRDAILIP